GVAGAEDLVLRQPGAAIAGRVRVAEEQKLDALLAVVEDEAVVEDDARHLQRALLDVLASRRAFAGLLELVGAVDAQQQGAVRLGDDAGSLLGKDRVAVGVVAVVVRVEDVADRLVGRLLDRLDDVAGLLGEVGVDDDNVILEDDPDVVAAAE